MVRDNAQGYPRASLKDVPPGDYTVQAVLNVYETFHRSDGTTVKLTPDRGEGQHWNLAPGNLLSKPRIIHIGPGAPPISVSLDEVIPAISPESDTKYIRHIRVQSKLLTTFWGRPVYLSAIVLVPEGYDFHTRAHYPLIVFHDHFVTGFNDFRETPPDANLKPDYSDMKIAYGVDDDDIDASVSKEFGALVRGGMTPLEALQAATINGARLLDLDKDIGTIEPGKVAGRVAVKGDPLQDITVMEHVAWVMKAGAVVKPITR